jgi:hypothetical protein
MTHALRSADLSFSDKKSTNQHDMVKFFLAPHWRVRLVLPHCGLRGQGEKLLHHGGRATDAGVEEPVVQHIVGVRVRP